MSNSTTCSIGKGGLSSPFLMVTLMTIETCDVGVTCVKASPQGITNLSESIRWLDS
jgi:hypothetical protein